MSNARQCPSTNGKRPPRKARPAPAGRSDATGRTLWRSLDEVADTPEFREFLEREFPAHASELSDPTRRQFLRVMGASLALAGAATMPACRRPEHHIMPYTRQPEDVIPGKPLYYATAMPLPGGGAEGLLVETHEGRPTKIEGNPLHPVNQGRSTSWSQASVLDLYDPDRLKSPTRLGEAEGERAAATWSGFEQFASNHFSRFDRNNGAGLFFLVDKQSSPSRNRLRDAIKRRWPRAQWLPYEPVEDANGVEGARLAFGRPMRPRLRLGRAKTIVSIERDFLIGEDASLPDMRGFASGRRVIEAEDSMNRLYVVEAGMSLAGGAADHRMRLRPSQIPGYVAALARAVFERIGGGWSTGRIAAVLADFDTTAALEGVEQEWIDAVADDLVEHGDEAVVVVGETQPPAVHALAHAINNALGAIGSTITMAAVPADLAAPSADAISRLSRSILAGSVDTLVCLNCNPVYDAPANLDFAAKHRRVPTTIALNVNDDETGAASTWQLNAAHYLETWSDVQAADGAWSVAQPMIAPLFDGRGSLELLALIAGEDTTDPYEIVRTTWRQAAPGMGGLSDGEFDKKWRRALHDGLLAGSADRPEQPAVDQSSVAQAVSQLSRASGGGEGLEVLFVAGRTLREGRSANNGWLLELPDPITKVSWDNPALVSAATAERLGAKDGDLITLEVDGRSLEIPVWRSPGMADDTVVLALGWGRERGGRLGTGVGDNTFALRTTAAMRHAKGATVSRAGGKRAIACVQDHWSMEGRSLIREFDLAAWRAHGQEVITPKDAYGSQRELNFAERAGPLTHTPKNLDIYKRNQAPGYETGGERDPENPPPSPQWGMTIDLATCSGCGACTTACQAENNIPVVGKNEVIKGREMHWIRVDRYYASPEESSLSDFGDVGPYTGGRRRDDVEMLVQPVACVHCENAPCETVCPVNATIHGPEGTNNMAYNRCIGTRYCSNNCPYKVRRFNFFDYATKVLKGDWVGKDALGGVIKDEQWVPPRLRERVDEGDNMLRGMQYNPDVTVRERGVMEKCTYCIQRINAARIETKLNDLDGIPDGYFQTACQQACPTDSIVFGDIMDPLSKVRSLRHHGRSYMLLAEWNTWPRTTHLARIRNPNPRLRQPVVDPFEHHGAGHDGDHGDSGGDHGESTDTHDEGRVMSLPVLGSPRRAPVIGGRA